MKKRAVSAPYCSIKDCGSTPLFFDLDMVVSSCSSTVPSFFSLAPMIWPLASFWMSISLSQK